MSTNEVEQYAQSLIGAGFMSTSQRYRHVARVPLGMTADEAIAAAEPGYEQDPLRGDERLKRAYYARVYAQGDDKLVLTRAQFRAFKRLGGRCA